MLRQQEKVIRKIVLFLSLIGMFGCGVATTEESSEETVLDMTLLPDTVLSEMKSNLAAGSLVSDSSNEVGFTLTSAVVFNERQINIIINRAQQAVDLQSLTYSEDLIKILPEIVSAAQSALIDLGMSSIDREGSIRIIVGSVMSSLEGRHDKLSEDSSTEGKSPLETTCNKIAKASFSSFNEIELSSENIHETASVVIGDMIDFLDDAGLRKGDVVGCVKELTAGAVGSLDKIDAIDSNNLGLVLESMVSAATSALENIRVADFTTKDLLALVSAVSYGTTSALNEIDVMQFDSENASSAVIRIVSGANSGLSGIKMGAYDASTVKGLQNSIKSGVNAGIEVLSIPSLDILSLKSRLDSLVYDNPESIDLDESRDESTDGDLAASPSLSDYGLCSEVMDSASCRANNTCVWSETTSMCEDKITYCNAIYDQTKCEADPNCTYDSATLYCSGSN